MSKPRGLVRPEGLDKFKNSPCRIWNPCLLQCFKRKKADTQFLALQILRRNENVLTRTSECIQNGMFMLIRVLCLSATRNVPLPYSKDLYPPEQSYKNPTFFSKQITQWYPCYISTVAGPITVPNGPSRARIPLTSRTGLEGEREISVLGQAREIL
jgi:hypothetical protein